MFYSGLALRCQIIGENLECTLSLPTKFRTFVEGLAGNFNGDPTDDLVNRETNTNVVVSSSSNDLNILDACRSCELIQNENVFAHVSD